MFTLLAPVLSHQHHLCIQGITREGLFAQVAILHKADGKCAPVSLTRENLVVLAPRLRTTPVQARKLFDRLDEAKTGVLVYAAEEAGVSDPTTPRAGSSLVSGPASFRFGGISFLAPTWEQPEKHVASEGEGAVQASKAKVPKNAPLTYELGNRGTEL